MGRGRAKAKQTKVARELKYGTGVRARPAEGRAGRCHPKPALSWLVASEADEDEDGTTRTRSWMYWCC